MLLKLKWTKSYIVMIKNMLCWEFRLELFIKVKMSKMNSPRFLLVSFYFSCIMIFKNCIYCSYTVFRYLQILKKNPTYLSCLPSQYSWIIWAIFFWSLLTPDSKLQMDQFYFMEKYVLLQRKQCTKDTAIPFLLSLQWDIVFLWYCTI